MTHTIENALIAGGLLTLFIVPIYVVARRAQNKRAALLNQKLQGALTQHNLNLTRSEHLGRKMLGWDQQNQKLVYTDHEHPEAVIYDLQTATKSYVLKSMNGTSVKSITLQVTDLKQKLVCSLPFYHQFMDNEMKLNQFESQAKDWEQLLNSHLNK
jgi:hypothetical protein